MTSYRKHYIRNPSSSLRKQYNNNRYSRRAQLASEAPNIQINGTRSTIASPGPLDTMNTADEASLSRKNIAQRKINDESSKLTTSMPKFELENNSPLPRGINIPSKASGVDLDGKFFLIVPKNEDKINSNIDEGLTRNGGSTKHSKLGESSDKSKFSFVQKLELSDFNAQGRNNFDFLELPNFNSDVNPNIKGVSDILVNPTLKQINSHEVLNSVELIDASHNELGSSDFDAHLDDNFELDIPSVEDNVQLHPGIPRINSNPSGLEGFVDGGEFYKIVSNILKLDTPLNGGDGTGVPLPPVHNTITSPTGIPLPGLEGPEITTRRPEKSILVESILPKPGLNAQEPSSTGIPLPIPASELFPNNPSYEILEPVDQDYIDFESPEDQFDDPIVPDFNVTHLLTDFNFQNFKDNNFTQLSQTWKMTNRTATIVLVLLSSLAEAMKFNGHGLPNQFKENVTPDPLTEGFFSTPFFLSTTPNPGTFPTPDSRFSVPKVRSSSCDPMNPPPCSTNNSTFCIVDKLYPRIDVEKLIKKDRTLVDKYADVSDQTANDLVGHMSAREEASFDYSYYNAGVYDITHWIGPEGYICPSRVEYTTPRRARNVKGEWRVIVNDGHFYTQTLRMETCLYPLTPCRLLAPCFKSKCIQKYMYHRLLSMDPCHPEKGLFIDMYRLPSACSCYAPAMLN